MAKTEQLIGEIRQVLVSADDVDREKLKVLTETYASACSRVHERAAKCRELVRNGLQDRAVRLAKQEPDLREEFELVDFPENTTWFDLCERLELTIPPLLDTHDIGEVIDELYVISDGLDRLLRVQRRLAIAHAPIKERLRVLRKICKEDPGHDHWQQDARAMEIAYMEELARRGERADRNGDLAALEEIVSEVGSGEWLRKPPGKFIKRLHKLILPHRQRLADSRYSALLEEIRQAHGAMDEGQCRRLMDRWREVKEETGCEPDAAIAAEVGPTQAWLRELQDMREEDAAFGEACAALEAAIDEEKDRSELERLAADVLRFGRDMPQLLAARFSSRMTELARGSRRKFTLRLTAIAGGIVLLAAGITMGLFWYSKHQRISKWQTQITSVLNKGDLEGAERLLDKLARESRQTYAAPEIQKLRVRHQRALRADAERKASFEKALASVEKAGVESPTMAALERADELARGLGEKGRVQDWREKIQRHADKLRRKREEVYENQLEKLEKLSGELSIAQDTNRDDLEALVSKCLDLAGMLTGKSDVPPLLRKRAAAIRDSALKASKDASMQRERRRAIRGALDRMAVLYSSPDDLAAALSAFGKKYPEHPLASEFLRAVRMAPEWRAADAWGRLAAGWEGRLRVTDAETVGKRLRELQDFAKANPRGPHLTAMGRYTEYLLTASKAMPEGTLRHCESTEQLLTSPLIAGLCMIRGKDGRCYYLPNKKLAPITLGGVRKGWRFNYVVNASLSTKNTSLRHEEIDGDIKKIPVQAPQATFAAKALKLLRTSGPARWESCYLHLAAMVRGEPKMDPILKAILMRMFLQYAVDCYPAETKEIDRIITKLGTLELDVAWMDPNDADARRIRGQIARILQGIKPFTRFIERAEGTVAEGLASLEVYRPAGVMLESPGKVVLGGSVTAGSLHVLWSAPAGQARFTKIGKMVKGKAVIDRGVSEKFPCGTLVFVRQEKAQPTHPER